MALPRRQLLFAPLLMAAAAPAEQEVRVGALAGTLCDLDRAAPLVVIVPGSGPVDRDGNGPGGLRAATYRRLARRLAARRIASLRIDKRGQFSSSGAGNGDVVVLGDYVDDLLAWAAAMRARRSGPLFVAGHSEGGLVALAAAPRLGGLAGLILLATPGRSMGQLLRVQLRANPAVAPLLPAAEASITALEAGRRVPIEAVPPELWPLFRPSVQGLLISEFAADPAALLAAYAGPALIVEAGLDRQVGPEDGRRLMEARPDAGHRIVPGANHLFKPVADGGAAADLVATCDADRPLAPGLVAAIVQFVHPARS